MTSHLKLTTGAIFSSSQHEANHQRLSSSRFWYRVSEQSGITEANLIKGLQKHAVRFVQGDAKSYWTKLKELTGSAAEASDATNAAAIPNITIDAAPIYSFASSIPCDPFALQHCSAIEWSLMPSDLSRPIDRLQQLSIDIPIDTNSERRFGQRIDLLRNSVGREVRIGVAMPASAIMSNIELMAHRGIEFLTIVSPTAVLKADHVATRMMDDDIVDLIPRILKAKRAIGRDDLSLVLQTQFANGFEAYAYIGMGVDVLLMNGWNWSKQLASNAQESTSLAASFLNADVSIQGGNSTESLTLKAVELFFDEFADAERYCSIGRR
jgi:hypothetical protein